ncbi:hypothetical protein LY76DRAFT_611434 [Colletotrichum caudatum]|nr:hypothetical protein LY76DRAFT_611434 [Colletotrichum caudatum]
MVPGLYESCKIAALIWGSVKLTMQVILNFSSYYDRVSDLFMQFAKDCPRFAEYQALFPSSLGLQKAVCDFNASIICCCRHVVEVMQRPWQTHLRNAFLRSFQQEFDPDLENIRSCGSEIKKEIELAKAQADRQDQTLQQAEREAAFHERHRVRSYLRRLEGGLDTIKNDQLQQGIRRAVRTLPIIATDSTPSASAIEHTYLHESRAGQIVTFFFPQFDDPASLSAEAALRSIIRQSLDPVRLSSSWEYRLAELDWKPSSELNDLTSLLLQKVKESKRFYVFIDALDEFEPPQRRALLGSLASVVSRSRLRVFVSSRESLSGELKDRFPTIHMVSMASAEARIDIATFVNEALEERQQNEDLMVQDKSVIDDIRQTLINHADGMFLWVTFLLDEICAQTCDDDNLTETLERALHRIAKRQNIAKRPLTLYELREAMSIEILQPSSEPGRLVNGIHQLPAWCENLIRVDEELKTAGFAHKTVYEFIVGRLSGPDFTSFHFSLEDADHKAGEICVTYLNFSDFVTTVTQRPQPVKVKIDPAAMAHSALKNSWKLPESIRNAIIVNHKKVQAKGDLVMPATYNRSDNAESINMLQDRYSFLEYASVHWISHTTRFSSRASSTWSLWRQIFTQGHGLVTIPWASQQEPGALNSDILPWSLSNLLGKISSAEQADAIQTSAAEGDAELLDALLEGDSSWCGHIMVVEYPSSMNGGTALQAASGGGHIEVVERLLSAGADVNADPSSMNGRTALQAASGRGHVEVVERLLSAGADVNYGHVEVVERLLSAGADVNATDTSGRTALTIASKYGHVEVVEPLNRRHFTLVERLRSAGAYVR